MFLVPAETIEAKYIKASLILSATGQASYDILDVHFRRDIHLAGGLGFHLRGFENGRSSTEALNPTRTNKSIVFQTSLRLRRHPRSL